jgi:hypothetical protein
LVDVDNSSCSCTVLLCPTPLVLLLLRDEVLDERLEEDYSPHRPFKQAATNEGAARHAGGAKAPPKPPLTLGMSMKQAAASGSARGPLYSLASCMTLKALPGQSAHPGVASMATQGVQPTQPTQGVRRLHTASQPCAPDLKHGLGVEDCGRRQQGRVTAQCGWVRCSWACAPPQPSTCPSSLASCTASPARCEAGCRADVAGGRYMQLRLTHQTPSRLCGSASGLLHQTPLGIPPRTGGPCQRTRWQWGTER